CEDGLHGDLHGLSLPEMLQMYHFSRRAVSLSFDQGGRIDLRDGDLVHAELGALRGEEALATMLARSAGAVRTRVLHSTERTITRRFDAVLLDVLRALDERRRDETARDAVELDDSELSFGELDDEYDFTGKEQEKGDETMGK